MKKTFVVISIALIGTFAACHKSNKTTQQKFVVAQDVTSVTSVVDFGTPPAGGGVCGGKGICNSVSSIQGQNQAGTTVTWSVSSQNSAVLIMSFSLSGLGQSQPEQVAYFTDPSGLYTFAGTYNFTDPMYAPLNLINGANINPQTPGTVIINGDLVTVAFTYAHN